MRRVCCPIPTFHIFGQIGGTFNINAPGYFTAFPSILPDTLEAMRTIQEEKCTAIIGPPIIFLNILHHPERKEYDLSSLLFGLTGAAPVNSQMMEQLEREIPIKSMCQTYGQTENTGALTQSVYAEDDKVHRLTSVGIAMPHVELKITDLRGHVLSIGKEGEICARGFNIMKGTSDASSFFIQINNHFTTFTEFCRLLW